MTPRSDYPRMEPGESAEHYHARMEEHVGPDLDRVLRHFEENNIELPSWLAKIVKPRNAKEG